MNAQTAVGAKKQSFLLLSTWLVIDLT